MDASRAANGWAHTIITGFDIGSIDYIIIGQGTPPVTINENQQVFLAPWMAPSQGDPLDPTEDVANQELPAPPQKPSPVNLTNYDAEGWYALEQAWAKSVPGFVPEPPEGIEATGRIEETTIETDPSHGAGVTPPTTDVKNLGPTAEAETEPVLDPRIVQILDLKATDGTNIIVKFLIHEGLCRSGSLGSMLIDRAGLLAYLLERDANSLKAFSRLLEEFKSTPQIDLPSDEDLQIDLHSSFFHYPHGERWFWEQCSVKDCNGFLLPEGGFGVNVLAFMAAARAQEPGRHSAESSRNARGTSPETFGLRQQPHEVKRIQQYRHKVILSLTSAIRRAGTLLFSTTQRRSGTSIPGLQSYFLEHRCSQASREPRTADSGEAETPEQGEGAKSLRIVLAAFQNRWLQCTVFSTLATSCTVIRSEHKLGTRLSFTQRIPESR